MDNSTPGQQEPLYETQPEPQPPAYERAKQVYERVKKEVKRTATEMRDYYRRSPRLQRLSYQGKFLPAFWTVASLISVIINIILVAVVISLGHHLFELKTIVSDGLVNGLYNNFVLMDKAHIVTTIPVETTIQVQDTIPVVFDLPLNQDTQVVLVQDTTINGATIYLNSAPVPIDITLPSGTPLQINLDLVVPVNQTVPVNLSVPITLQVPVDIALDQTDLHQPFVGLQGVVEPYRELMGTVPNSVEQVSLCKHWWSGWLCGIILGKP
jgi:hypothetical protein